MPDVGRTAPRTSRPRSPSSRRPGAKCSPVCSTRRTSPTSGSSANSRAGARRSLRSTRPSCSRSRSRRSGPPPIGVGLISGDWWSPTRPLKSYLTGETCQQWADDYTKRTNQQWTQPLMHVVAFEMAIWALQHATDPTSKDAIVAAITTDEVRQHRWTDMDFSAPVPAQLTSGPEPCPSRTCTSRPCAPASGSRAPSTRTTTWSSTTRRLPMVPVEAQQIPVPAIGA